MAKRTRSAAPAASKVTAAPARAAKAPATPKAAPKAKTEKPAAKSAAGKVTGATIIIKALPQVHRTHHHVGVNGRIRALQVGVEVQVSAAELAALEASNVEFETVTPLPEGEGVAAGVEGSSSAAETPAQETTEEVDEPEKSDETATEQTGETTAS